VPGGKASAALTDAVFLEAFRNDVLEPLGDAGVVELPSGERLAISTDSFVVSPWRFPGGSIGSLAVHGTVNDLAVAGAHRPGSRPGSSSRRACRSRPPRVADEMAEAAARPASASSPATRRSSRPARPTGSTSTPPASA
jgi:hypothetical protein